MSNRSDLMDLHYSRVYSNFLMHYKYIKREAIPGAKKGETKWKYYYNEPASNQKNANIIDVVSKKFSVLFESDKEKEKDTKEEAIRQRTQDIAKRMEEKQKRDEKLRNATSEKEKIEAGKQEQAKRLADEKHEREAANRLAQENDRRKQMQKESYKMAQDYERSKKREPELEKLRTELEENNPCPELPLKSKPTTCDEDMALVNPDYDKSDPLTSQNCAYCTMAYDMRRRGYDIESKHDSNGLSTYQVLRNYDWSAARKQFKQETGIDADLTDFPDALIHTVYIESNSKERELDAHSRFDDAPTHDRKEAVTRLERELSNYGEGSRGMIAMSWKFGGAHAIAWEVQNGKVVYRDCQVNKKIDISTYMSRSDEMQYVRLDNLSLVTRMQENVKKHD